MASNSGAVPILPNPSTPLAFLPPVIADQYQTACFVVVAGFSAFVWDWLMSISQEYAVIRRSRFSVPIVAYFLSRVGTMGFLVCTTILQVASVPHCQALLYILGSFSILGMCSTSLLFFYRVRAVYGNSIFVTYSFGFLWAATFGMSFVFPFASYGGHIGPTERCIITSTRSYTFMPVIANAIHDTLVFLAISYRIISYTAIGDSWSARAKSFFTADGLPRLSRALLQSGQQFYFATIGLSLSFAVMLLVPVPSVYRAMLSVPNLALENAMACRVYRAVKLGSIQDPPTTHSAKTLRFNTATAKSSREMPFNQPTSDEPRNIVQVDMTDLEVGVEHKYGKPSLLQGDSDAYDGA